MAAPLAGPVLSSADCTCREPPTVALLATPSPPADCRAPVCVEMLSASECVFSSPPTFSRFCTPTPPLTVNVPLLGVLLSLVLHIRAIPDIAKCFNRASWQTSTFFNFKRSLQYDILFLACRYTR